MYRAECFGKYLILWGDICLFSRVVCTKDENMKSNMELQTRI